LQLGFILFGRWAYLSSIICIIAHSELYCFNAQANLYRQAIGDQFSRQIGIEVPREYPNKKIEFLPCATYAVNPLTIFNLS